MSKIGFFPPITTVCPSYLCFRISRFNQLQIKKTTTTQNTFASPTAHSQPQIPHGTSKEYFCLRSGRSRPRTGSENAAALRFGRDGSNLPMGTADLSEATGGLSRARPRCAGALARSGVRCVVAVSGKEMGKEMGFIRRAVSARPEGAAVDPAARGGRVAAGSVCRDFLSQLDPLKHSQVSFLPSLLQTSSLPSPFFL